MFFNRLSTKVAFKVMAVLFASLFMPVLLQATEYPVKPIELIVPYAAGGVTDVIARLFSPYSKEYLGQPMVVVNKPGAGGVMAMDSVAKSKPDGYTLAVGAISTLPVLKAINPKLPYDPVEDFTHICRILANHNVILVRSDSSLNTLEKLVDYAKKNPDKLSYGSPGYAGSPHIAGELFQQSAGIKLVHVPYKGNAPALMAMLGGHIDMIFITYSDVAQHIKGGKVIPLAVPSANRCPELPDVPTVVEKGYPGVVIQSWNCIVGPKGISEPIVEKLENYFQKVLDRPDVKTKMAEFGMIRYWLDSAGLRKFVQEEVVKYTDVAKKANIKMQ